MNKKIFILTVLMSCVVDAKNLSLCESQKEQIQLPGSNVCVTDFANPGTACLCNSNLESRDKKILSKIEPAKKSTTYASSK